jgi:uncharacterized protein (TIGR03067 family)
VDDSLGIRRPNHRFPEEVFPVMKNRAWIRLAAALLLAVDVRAEDKATEDGEKLVGIWACASGVNDGKALAEETVQKLRLTLTKDGGYKTERGKQVLFDSTYKIDAGKQPKHIDLIGTEEENTGKPAQGIYVLEGDTLKICYTMPRQGAAKRV